MDLNNLVRKFCSSHNSNGLACMAMQYNYFVQKKQIDEAYHLINIGFEERNRNEFDKRVDEQVNNLLVPGTKFHLNKNPLACIDIASLNVTPFQTCIEPNTFHCTKSESINDSVLRGIFQSDALTSNKQAEHAVAGFKTCKESLSDHSRHQKESLDRRVKRTESGLSKSSSTNAGHLGPSIYAPFNPPYSSRSNHKSEGVASQLIQNTTQEKLKHIDERMVELIRAEIMDCSDERKVQWSDIAGLAFAKKTIQEIVVLPMLRPDIFKGLRRPPKGVLLFGPPGTGKTLIGRCVAAQSNSTFFCVSASSLTSKYVGEGEKLVRALFAVARVEQPAVIFIDEVDSLLTQRSDNEHESSRRIKTEFLVQLDGAATEAEERLLVIGATNRPQELDEAARRRFVKRLYIPLPDLAAREELIRGLMQQESHRLCDANFHEIAELSEGYSGADVRHLCAEAALGPIRNIDFSEIGTIEASKVRPIEMTDFTMALTHVKSSVSSKDLDLHLQWNRTYGSGY